MDDLSRLVKERLNIVDIISQYLPLRRTGKNYVGLCPFHNEKTPSFTVSEEKQIFHCFGCGVGGDVFSFVMRQEGIDFKEALRILAEKAGIELKEKGSTRGLKEIYEALKRAMEFYHRNLSSPEGERARRYLEERGLKGDTIRTFMLGCSDREGKGLPAFLKSSGISMEVAKRAGLVTIKGGRAFDYLRGRVIFPIFDVTGRVIAFGGRVMGEGMPKYLNSPETPVFKKGRALYGLNLAKEDILREGWAIVVEGYMDLITLHQGGIRNVVATLGTALTSDHGAKLRRYARTVYALFDSDEAGRKAALRAMETFLNEDTDLRVVILPDGRDPDQFMREEGAEGLRALIEKAPSILEFYLDEITRDKDLTHLQERLGVLKGIVAILSRVRDPLKRGLYVKEVSQRFGVEESILLKAMDKGQGGISVEEGLEVRGNTTEETILWALIHGYDLSRYHLPSILSSFEDRDLREAGRKVMMSLQKGMDSPMDLLDEGVKSRLSRLCLLYDEMEDEEVEGIVRDCVRRLKAKRLKREKERLKMEIQKAEVEGRDGFLIDLLKRRQHLSRIEHSPEELLHYQWGDE